MSIWADLDDALSSCAVACERGHALVELLETPYSGVHVDDGDDEVELSATTRSPEVTRNQRGPRLVDGARGSHIAPGLYQESARGWDSGYQDMKILAEDRSSFSLPSQGSRGDSSSDRTGERYFSEGVGNISHSQCLEYLYKVGANLMDSLQVDKEKVCRVLLNMADIVTILRPANEPSGRDLLNMTQWKASLGELVQEMKTVEENFRSLTGNSSVFVLTSSPFPAFLRALAAEIADRRC